MDERLSEPEIEARASRIKEQIRGLHVDDKLAILKICELVSMAEHDVEAQFRLAMIEGLKKGNAQWGRVAAEQLGMDTAQDFLSNVTYLFEHYTIQDSSLPHIIGETDEHHLTEVSVALAARLAQAPKDWPSELIGALRDLRVAIWRFFNRQSKHRQRHATDSDHGLGDAEALPPGDPGG